MHFLFSEKENFPYKANTRRLHGYHMPKNNRQTTSIVINMQTLPHLPLVPHALKPGALQQDDIGPSQTCDQHL